MTTVKLSVEVLRSVMGVIEYLWVDPVLVFSGRGLSLYAYSIRDVALVSVDLTSKDPDPSLGDRIIPIRLDLDELHDYLNSGDTFEGIVVLRIFEDTKILRCKLENLPSALEMKYEDVLDFNLEYYQIDEVDQYDAVVKLPVAKFGVLMGLILIDGDKAPEKVRIVEISVQSNYIQFRGNDFCHRWSDEEGVTSLDVKKPVLVNCNLELLDWVFKAIHFSDSSYGIGYNVRKLTLSLHSKSPIKVEFNIADKHTICFYLVRSRRTVLREDKDQEKTGDVL